VVTQTQDGRENEIKEYTVGVEVLQKPTSFDPMLDASVRIHAIRLRKLLAEYYHQAPAPPALRILLPKGSYVPVFAEVSPTIPGLTDPGYAALATNANNVNQESVCIIPFTSYIHLAGIDFSADGFCQFLSEKLSLFQDIRVVSYQSACKFFSNGGQLQNLGHALQVQCYLAGTLEIENQRIRAMVHLNDAFSNKVV
jgi:TolB-like protein